MGQEGTGARTHLNSARGLRAHTLRSVSRATSGGGGGGGVSLREKKKEGCNANRNERSQGRSVLHGHGTFSTSKVGGWLRLAVGSWRLVAVGSGWQRLAVGGWWSPGAVLKGGP